MLHLFYHPEKKCDYAILLNHIENPCGEKTWGRGVGQGWHRVQLWESISSSLPPGISTLPTAFNLKQLVETFGFDFLQENISS